MELYKKINILAKEKNLSQRDLSNKIGLAKTTIQGILYGRHVKNISLRAALGFARAFDIDIYELIEGTEYEETNI